VRASSILEHISPGKSLASNAGISRLFLNIVDFDACPAIISAICRSLLTRAARPSHVDKAFENIRYTAAARWSSLIFMGDPGDALSLPTSYEDAHPCFHVVCVPRHHCELWPSENFRDGSFHPHVRDRSCSLIAVSHSSSFSSLLAAA
jgi:hypothetical protein